ncbi:hypothetical protein Q5752_000735 [Cryptotrichosporon argae]
MTAAQVLDKDREHARRSSLRSLSPASSSSDPLRRVSPTRTRSGSLSSVRFDSSPGPSRAAGRAYQPAVPSHLHEATVLDDESSAWSPSPDAANGASANGTHGTHPSSSAGPSRSSHSRRVRSEAGPQTYLARAKRPSIVTGGYESTDSDSDDDADGLAWAGAHALYPLPNSRSAPRGLAAQVQDRQSRRRAQSLMSPLRESHSPKRRLHREGSNGLPPIVTRRQQQADSRPATAVPRLEDRRLDGRTEHGRAGVEQVRKGKTRMGRDESRAALAASLGLLADPREATLSPEQINELVNDSSVASALRLMGNPPVRPRRVSHVLDAAISPTTSSPAPSAPFLATAPPALLSGDGAGHARDRTVSVSSSVAPPPRKRQSLVPAATPVSPIVPGAQPSPRRRRESSAATLDGEGGHVPFTHHVQPILSEDEHTDAERSVAPAPSVAASSVEVDGKGHLGKKSSKGGLGALFRSKTRKRDSMAATAAATATVTTTTTTAATAARSGTDHESSPRPSRERERERDRERDAQRAREAEHEAYIRRKEAERREAELAQERTLRAFTQVHAHPESQAKAQQAATHLDGYYDHVYDGLADPPRLNLLAVLRWRRRVDEQKEAKRRWEAAEHAQRERASWMGAGLQDSPTSIRSQGAALERKRTVSNPAQPGAQARGWQYSLDDIAAYKACEGRVEIFVPPFQPSPGGAAKTDAATSRKPVSHVSHNSEASSITKDPVGFTSPSVVSLFHSTPDGSIAPLSRSTSRENSQRGRREHHTHRPHQSLGSLPPSSLGHAIRAPFENLKNATRKQRTMPTLHSTPGTHANSPIDDDESGRERASRAGPAERDRHGGAGAKPSSLALFRRHDNDTDDEHHQFRRLFAKSSRASVAGPHAAAAGRVTGTATPMRMPHDAQARARMIALREAFERESEHRHQAGAGDDDARRRERDNEAFVERLKKVSATRQRLEHHVAVVEQADASFEHYVKQITQVEKLFKVSADVALDFAGLDALRPARTQYPTEDGDALSPLRSPNASGSDAAARRPAPRRPARRPSALTANLPSLAFAFMPFPRRTSIDPATMARVDPISRAELAIAHARDKMRDQAARRKDATRQLQSMIGQIDALIKQKDVVRAWSKTALDHIHALNEQLEGLRREINSSSRARMGRLLDSFYDGSARALSPFVRSLFRLTFVVYRPRRQATDVAVVDGNDVQGQGNDRRAVVQPRRNGTSWMCALVVLVLAVVVSFFIIGGMVD